MGHGNSESLHLEKFVPSKQLKTTTVVLIAIGLLGLGYGLLKNQDGLWPAYLTAFFYVTCLSLGAMFFVAINHIAKAGWSSSIRRLAEGMTSFFPVILVGGLVLIY
jgi:hypothetical protein